MKNRPEYIVVHHSAGNPNRTAADIRRWHTTPKSKGGPGWRDIGYHFVVTVSGLVEVGRPSQRPGAHARGLNARSIGVCCVGNFDASPPPQAQWYSLTIMMRALQQLHHVPAERVIGHREINALLPERYHTTKNCPGRAFNMDALRAGLHQTIEPADKELMA